MRRPYGVYAVPGRLKAVLQTAHPQATRLSRPKNVEPGLRPAAVDGTMDS